MGIRFFCPNGHKLNVKKFQAGKKGVCPYCGARTQIPLRSTRKSSRQTAANQPVPAEGPPTVSDAPPQGGAAGADRIATLPLLSEGNTSAAQPASLDGSSASPTAAALPSDPLLEAGDLVWYVRPVSGGQFGPAGADLMRAWLAEGRIGRDSLVWREGWEEWQEAAAVFPQSVLGAAAYGLEGLLSSDLPPIPAIPQRYHPALRASRGVRAAIVIGLLMALIILLSVLLWAWFREPRIRTEKTLSGTRWSGVSFQHRSPMIGTC